MSETTPEQPQPTPVTVEQPDPETVADVDTPEADEPADEVGDHDPER